MEVIVLADRNEISQDKFPPLSLAIGYFDGVHLGHQEVINKAKEMAKKNGWKSACLTFDPSPKAVFGNPDDVLYLTLLEEKISLMEGLQIDYLFIVPFTQDLAGRLPEQFIQEYIIQLHVKHLVAGFDFTYGKFGKGNMDTIEEHGKGNFTVTKIDKVTHDSKKISSTHIRNLIADGRVEEVPDYLGRYYRMTGIVVHGEKRGREIGFPTANIDASNQYVFPKIGIYVVRLYTGNKWVNGVGSIGFNPTFNEGKEKKFLEIHLIDFNRDIYGEKVIVEWHKRLRDEEKFSGIEALVEQISKDKQNAIDYFQVKSF